MNEVRKCFTMVHVALSVFYWLSYYYPDWAVVSGLVAMAVTALLYELVDEYKRNKCKS